MISWTPSYLVLHISGAIQQIHGDRRRGDLLSPSTLFDTRERDVATGTQNQLGIHLSIICGPMKPVTEIHGTPSSPSFGAAPDHPANETGGTHTPSRVRVGPAPIWPDAHHLHANGLALLRSGIVKDLRHVVSSQRNAIRILRVTINRPQSCGYLVSRACPVRDGSCFHPSVGHKPLLGLTAGTAGDWVVLNAPLCTGRGCSTRGGLFLLGIPFLAVCSTTVT